MKIFKQIEKLDITETFGDVLEDGDTITNFKEDGFVARPVSVPNSVTAPGSSKCGER